MNLQAILQLLLKELTFSQQSQVSSLFISKTSNRFLARASISRQWQRAFTGMSRIYSNYQIQVCLCYHLNRKTHSCKINLILSVELTHSHSRFSSNLIHCSNSHQIIIRSSQFRNFHTKRHLIIQFPLINNSPKTSSLPTQHSSNYNPLSYPCRYLNNSVHHSNKHLIHPTVLPISAITINRRSYIPGEICILRVFQCKLFALYSKDSIFLNLES